MFDMLDLFTGTGAFSIGLERTGEFRTVAMCENNKQRLPALHRLFPQVPIFDDIQTLTRKKLTKAGIFPTAICGGFPCQDLSNAGRAHGKQAGIQGARSGLFFEIIRIIREYRGSIEVVILENVTNLLFGPADDPGGWFRTVLLAFHEIGYDAEWETISASSVGAIQRRERVVIIAYPRRKRKERSQPSIRFECVRPRWSGSEADMRALFAHPFDPGPSWPAPLFRRIHDWPDRWKHRIEACGNAIHTGVAELAGYLALDAVED